MPVLQSNNHAPKRLATLGTMVLLASALQACSSQQVYGAGQAWQLRACSRINDAQERSRCMASASTSYEEYKRQAEAVRSGK